MAHRPARLVLDISGHGFGHLSQISPVVRAVRQRVPSLDIVVRSALSRERLEASLGPIAAAVEPAPEVGLVMAGPHVADVAATRRGYVRLHSTLAEVAADQGACLQALGADALLTDVAYTGLLGAARLGLPSVALCSLHWGEVVASYLGEDAEARRIRAEIASAYETARVFIVPAPRRSLPGLFRTLSVGPLVRTWGRNRADEIAAIAGCPVGTSIGLITFGGIGHGLPAARLPEREGWLWIVPVESASEAVAAATIPAARLQHLDFLDLVASSRLVLTKTGYGTFVECAYYGALCVFLSRPDWPESEEIEAWMTASGHGIAVSLDELANGCWMQLAERHLDAPRPPMVELGHDAAADLVIDNLGLVGVPNRN